MAKHRTGHIFKRGGNFYVRWCVNSKVFSKALRTESGEPITSRREAEEAKTKFMAPFTVADEAAALESIAGKLEGRRTELAKLEDVRRPPLRIVDTWSAFVASPNRPDSGESTLRQYEFQWKAFKAWTSEKHTERAFLRDVNTELAEEYAGTLNHGRLSSSTYNKHLNLLTLVFRVVRLKARLAANPWEDIQRKNIITHSRRELTLDELRKVCRSAIGELKLLLALGVYTGLRLGDCATLRWAEVDMGQGIIRRVPNKSARRNPKPVIVPIHPVCLALLVEIPEEKRSEFVLPEIAALYIRRIDLVTDMVQNHFLACGIRLHKAGTGKQGKRAVIEVGFHSLRHTFVSLCRASNAPLSVVESIVGHSSPAMTRHYTHTGELAATQAVALLPAVFGDAKAAPAQRDAAAILVEVRKQIEDLGAKNWKSKRNAVLDLLAGNP